MKRRFVVLLILVCSAHVLGFWVPSPPKGGTPAQIELPPGSSDTSYSWIEVPNVGVAVLPALAQHEVASTVKTTDRERDAMTHQIMAGGGLEAGQIGYTYQTRSNETVFKGSCLAVQAFFEKQPDEYTWYGLRLKNEFTSYSSRTTSNQITYTPPVGSNLFIISGYYRKTILSRVDAGYQMHAALLSFENEQTAKKANYISVNPQVFGVYHYSISRVEGYAGGFAGYAYSGFSWIKNQLPWGGLFSAGTTFGERVAMAADFALSQTFLVSGIELPVYISPTLSFSACVRYPYLFSDKKLSHPRVFISVNNRF